MPSKLIPVIVLGAMTAIPANAQVTIDFFTNDRRGFDSLDDDGFRFGPEERRGVGLNGIEGVRDQGTDVGVAQTPSFSQDPSLPIFFDAFLADNGGVPADGFNAFFQWIVTAGSVDLVGQPVVDPFGNPVVEFDERGGAVFGRFVDLGGSTGTPGVFTTRFSFPFLAGATYNLSFDFVSTDGNPSTATVTIGSQVFTVSSSSTLFGRFSQNFAFPTTTISRITFQDQGNDGAGLGIDNVVLSRR